MATRAPRCLSVASAAMLRTAACVLLLCVGAFAVEGSEGEPLQARLTPGDKEIHRPENSSIAVTCFAPDAEWTGPKNQSIDKINKVLVTGNSTRKLLMFTALSVEMSGTYTCSSKAKDSKYRPNSFNLTVVEPVSFVGPLQQTAQQSADATLKCVPRGSPPPEVAWLRNGAVLPLDKSGKFEVRKDGLLVKNVTRVDAGAYVCRAIQYLPAESVYKEHIINLTVEHRPEWHADYAKTSDVTYGYLGGLANLTCVAEAQPAGNITWLRGNKTINVGENVAIFGDGRNSTLQLNLTEAALFGDYTCNATNALGTRARVLTLKWGVRAPRPSVPQPQKSPDARHALIRVDRPPATPPPTPAPGAAAFAVAPTKLDLTGLRLLVRPSKAGSDVPTRVVDLPFNEFYEYMLPDLEPNSYYEVRAMWRNAAGLSEESAAGEIHTSDIPSSAPVAAAATAGRAAALLLAATAAILSS